MTPRNRHFVAILQLFPAMDGLRSPLIMGQSNDDKRPGRMSHARKEYKDFVSLTPDAYEAVLALGQVAGKAGMDKQLLELIKLRASQINGCAFCVQYQARGSACPRTSSIWWWSGARRRNSPHASGRRWRGRKH
jgi:alkylhydroperoxidase family enzyme